MSFEEVRKLRGLDKNFIRKADRKAKSGKAHTKQIEPEQVYGYSYLDCVMPPENMEYLAKLYDISSAHHAAVDAKVASVFGLGYQWVESPKFKRLKEQATTDAKKKKADKFLSSAKSTLEIWVEDFNDFDCFEEILRKVGVDYETTGNGYIEIGRNVDGSIGYIGHIPSQYMRVRRERDGFVQIFSNLVTYFRNFGENNPNTVTEDKSPNEVLHLKKYTPTNTYYGLPDILSAQAALAGNEFASRYNLDFFENKAVPRHVIIARKNSLSNTSVNRLIEFFESGLRGQSHRTLFIPLSDEEGAEIEFKSIETEAQDASFGQFRDANNEEIFMAHRIPLSRAGVTGKGTSLAASRDADKVFKEAYSTPEQKIFEKKFNRIVREVTDALVLKLNELSLTDEDTQSKIDERSIRNSIEVADEIRARKGLPERPDGKGGEPFAATAQQKADQKANAEQTRSRDRERSNEASDAANATGRNESGAGRRTA